jgi:hypothetical protein
MNAGRHQEEIKFEESFATQHLIMPCFPFYCIQNVTIKIQKAKFNTLFCKM